MITTIIFTIIGYGLLAIVSIMDKYILSESVKKPALYAFFSTIFFLVLFLAIPWSLFLIGLDWIWALISGLSFGFGLWIMFLGLKDGEASHIAPFIGGVVAVATYVFSLFLLGEVLPGSYKIGFIFLVLACFLLSFEKSRKHNGFHGGFLWATLAGILFALSHVTAKHIYEIYPFVAGLVWTKGSIGFVGILALFWPGVWSEIVKPATDISISHKRKQNAILIVVDKILGILGTLLIQYAIAIGSVIVVNSLAGIQYSLMFIIIYLLTKLRPKIFSEYFTRKEIFTEGLAMLLIVIGLFFMQ